jgi:hypothetical protein
MSEVWITVAAQDDVGSGGGNLSPYVDRFKPVQTGPSSYDAESESTPVTEPWSTRPGTYYWEVSAERLERPGDSS